MTSNKMHMLIRITLKRAHFFHEYSISVYFYVSRHKIINLVAWLFKESLSHPFIHTEITMQVLEIFK